VAAAEATAVRATLCEALLAAGIADRAVAVARECVPQRAADATVDAESVPALARLAHVEQAAGLSEWTRTAAAAEAALAPALDAASPEQCAPGLIRAGRELARTHARAGDLAGGLSLAEHTAAAAARGLPERHTERLLAERVLAELLLESGSADRAAALLETARGQSIDFDVREAVLRHFATAATLPL
jgi:hypothetical protein